MSVMRPDPPTERVSYVAPCPTCNNPAGWAGREADIGSGTTYRITCQTCTPTKENQ